MAKINSHTKSQMGIVAKLFSYLKYEKFHLHKSRTPVPWADVTLTKLTKEKGGIFQYCSGKELGCRFSKNVWTFP